VNYDVFCIDKSKSILVSETLLAEAAVEVVGIVLVLTDIALKETLPCPYLVQTALVCYLRTRNACDSPLP